MPIKFHWSATSDAETINARVWWDRFGHPVVPLTFEITIPRISGEPSADTQNNGPVEAVEAIGLTVSDMDRSIEFYSSVLSFEKLSDVEVAGGEYERLQGLFGLRSGISSSHCRHC